MKFSNATKLLCLFLSMPLMMGVMIGCQQSQETEPVSTPSTDATTVIILPTAYPDPIDIAGITMVISSLSDNAYYPVGSLWAVNKIAVPDA